MVRLTGCNLRCVWCDTAYAFEGGRTLGMDEIVDRVERFGVRRVEITGGEPLLQKDTPRLAQCFVELGYTVLCETSGERNIDLLPAGVRRIVDLKCPGSGESGRNDWGNLDRLRAGDELKFVVANRADFDWARDVIATHALEGRVPLLVSPVHQRVDPSDLADWILDSGLDVRLNLQLHKLLWGDVAGR